MLATMRHAFVTAISATLLVSLPGLPAALAGTAYLEISNKVDSQNRSAAVEINRKYKRPFLTRIPGAKSMLIRQHDVQVLHGFATAQQAQAYLSSDAVDGILQDTVLAAYRWQYIVSGVQIPKFADLLERMVTPAQMGRIDAALAPIVSNAAPR